MNIQDKLECIHKGKVRELYAIDAKSMVMVTTDNISAFDEVLTSIVPGKGELLNKISNFWFNLLRFPNHLLNIDLHELGINMSDIKDRAVIVKRLRPLNVEAIVRGYLVGSGYEDYKKTGCVCGIALPEGLELASKLETPIFTPSTKAAVGDHDENISHSTMADMIGGELAKTVADISLELYKCASNYAAKRGIIIADTKFEFGLDENDKLVLMDEVLTPDSSRFWDASEYKVGENPKSFDKQPVRDYIKATENFNGILPTEVIQETFLRYDEIYTRLVK